MMTFLKALILTTLEYYCVLTSPSKAGKIAEGDVQRSFRAHTGLKQKCNYWK